jgi:hypothetical protein
MLVYLMAIWSILRQFWCTYFKAIWIFSRFGILFPVLVCLVPRKIWQPCFRGGHDESLLSMKKKFAQQQYQLVEVA